MDASRGGGGGGEGDGGVMCECEWVFTYKKELRRNQACPRSEAVD